MRSLAASVLLTLALAPPRPAAAQLCSGNTSFALAPAHLNANLFINGNSQTYGAGFTLGSSRAFAGLGVAYSTYDDFNKESWVFSGSVGLESTRHARGTHICPVAGVGYVHGPSDITVTNADFSEIDFSAGLHASVDAVRDEKGFQLLPTTFVMLVGAFPKLSSSISSTTDHKFFALVGLGLGMIFDQRVSLKPAVTFPLGLSGGSASLGFVATFNLSSAH